MAMAIDMDNYTLSYWLVRMCIDVVFTCAKTIRLDVYL